MNLKAVIPKYFPKAMVFLTIPVYLYDWTRYITHSGVSGLRGKDKLIGRIVADYHVIEKGLTMPQSRLGFGKERIEVLIKYCTQFINTYGYVDKQVQHGISVILEYKEFHEKAGYKINQELLEQIDNFTAKFKHVMPSHQYVMRKDDYFRNSHSDFKSFSDSRRSIRNYSDKDVDIALVEKAITLARNAPSVCNRQGIRAHIYTEKETVQKMLEVQGGNRGFGHLANKVIAVTAELGAMHGLFERNQAFVDGGMWAMNLLYALQYYEIAACPLNCSNSPKKDKLLREHGGIGDSETFIMLISLGIPPDEFKIAASPRKEVEEIASFHN